MSATPDQRNQLSMPTASLTGPAIASPTGMASVITIMISEKT